MTPAKKRPSTPPFSIVGIGASAGGLEAIQAFFEATPTDSGMAFVVVQHLSPDHKSLMVELLSRKTEIPVCRADDGMAVEPDHIYLIPPKRNLTLFHGKLLLHEQKPRGEVNLPVDVFLRSLAEDQGERAVGQPRVGLSQKRAKQKRHVMLQCGVMKKLTAEAGIPSARLPNSRQA